MDLKRLIETPPWEWPEDAGETLMEVLRNSRGAAPARMDAAELAGALTVMNDQMADLLLRIVLRADEPVQLRAKAAISLGPALEQTDIEGFDDALSEPPVSEEVFCRIQETLYGIYRDGSTPKELRRRALEASVRAPQEWHPQAIRAATETGDKEWTLTAAFCMRWVPGFDEDILRLLDSDNPEIHYEAVCAAGDQCVSPAWPHIAALLASGETERELRLAAIEAAGSCGHPDAKKVLGELVQSEDEEIAETANDALMMAESDLGEYEKEEDEGEESSPPQVH